MKNKLAFMLFLTAFVVIFAKPEVSPETAEQRYQAHMMQWKQLHRCSTALEFLTSAHAHFTPESLQEFHVNVVNKNHCSHLADFLSELEKAKDNATQRCKLRTRVQEKSTTEKRRLENEMMQLAQALDVARARLIFRIEQDKHACREKFKQEAQEQEIFKHRISSNQAHDQPLNQLLACTHT